MRLFKKVFDRQLFVCYNDAKGSGNMSDQLTREEIEIADNIISKDLDRLPDALLFFLYKEGWEIIVVNRNFGVYGDKKCSFDRLLDETSCCDYETKRIMITRKDVLIDRVARNFSVILHEIGHAVDYSFVHESNGNTRPLSETNSHLILGFKRHRGLDSYANTTPQEYFAQGFQAYFQIKDEKDKQKYEYGHSRQELMRKDAKLYRVIKLLMNKFK